MRSQRGNPGETEYSVCIDCRWFDAVDDLDRDRGYRGACPECGSANTTAVFVDEYGPDRVDEQITATVESEYSNVAPRTCD